MQKKNTKNLALALKQNLQRRKAQVKKRKIDEENLVETNHRPIIKNKVTEVNGSDKN